MNAVRPLVFLALHGHEGRWRAPPILGNASGISATSQAGSRRAHRVQAPGQQQTLGHFPGTVGVGPQRRQFASHGLDLVVKPFARLAPGEDVLVGPVVLGDLILALYRHSGQLAATAGSGRAVAFAVSGKL